MNLYRGFRSTLIFVTDYLMFLFLFGQMSPWNDYDLKFMHSFLWLQFVSFTKWFTNLLFDLGSFIFVVGGENEEGEGVYNVIRNRTDLYIFNEQILNLS